MKRSSDNDGFIAHVVNAKNKKYTVEILLDESAEEIDVEGDCTCPVQYNCKHVAATLFAAQEKGWIRLKNKNNPLPWTSIISEIKPLTSTQESPSVKAWLEQLKYVKKEAPIQAFKNEPTETFFYMFECFEPSKKLALSFYKATNLKKGGFGKPKKIDLLNSQAYKKILNDKDKEIVAKILFYKKSSHSIYSFGDTLSELTTIEIQNLIPEIINTGKCYLSKNGFLLLDNAALTLGGNKKIELKWEFLENGYQQAQCISDDKILNIVFLNESIWYLDTDNHIFGQVLSEQPFHIIKSFMNAPTVAPQDSKFLHNNLTKLFSEKSELLPKAIEPIKLKQNKNIIPELHLELLPLPKGLNQESGLINNLLAFQLNFNYGKTNIPFNFSKEETREEFSFI